MKESSVPLVFDIARGSSEDGPGIRTVVFLKGCPLRCVWCHNPESQSAEAEEFYYEENCIRCGQCRKGCYSRARRPVGEYFSPEELVEKVLRDRMFYESSGGGVTFSGGEPLLFMDYLEAVMKPLKRENVHITIETSGHYDPDRFEKQILPYTDLIYFDLKVMDPALHQKFTGRPNDLILSNFRRLLLKPGIHILPRVLLIPDISATEENIRQTAVFLLESGVNKCGFLSFNPSGKEKLRRLNHSGFKVPGALPEKPMTLDEENHWIRLFSEIAG